MLAAPANPFLGFEHEVCELSADLLGQKLQQSDTKQEVDLNTLLELGVLESRVQKVGKLALPDNRLRRPRDFAVGFPAMALPAIDLGAVGL